MIQFLFSMLFLNSLLANDCVDCTYSGGSGVSKNVSSLNDNLIKVVEKINNQDLKDYNEADAFLQKIINSTNFKDELVLIEINKVKPICLNESNEKIFLSKACTTLAKLHGKLADKNKMTGLSDGKLFFKYIKKALQINPHNSDAALFYAQGVYGVYDQISSTVAATALGINLEVETKNAIKALELTDQKRSSFYKLLKDELD